MTTTTESTSTFSGSSPALTATGTRRWQGTFAAAMAIALTGMVALAFGSLAGRGPGAAPPARGPAPTSQACGQAAGAFERC
jgi:hypothetical protein